MPVVVTDEKNDPEGNDTATALPQVFSDSIRGFFGTGAGGEVDILAVIEASLALAANMLAGVHEDEAREALRQHAHKRLDEYLEVWLAHGVERTILGGKIKRNLS